jgi:methionyl-tRNA synthetase
MSSTEYLNYESGKFSKSKGIGVFGSDAKDTGIPADVWRFYIFYNRPETSDYTFTWADFQAIVNKELIGNFGNLVNRTLSLWQRNYGAELPTVDMGLPANQAFWVQVAGYQQKSYDYMDWADLRDGLRSACELSDFGNKLIADSEPWKLIKTDPVETRRILANLVYLVRDLAIMMRPFIPGSAEKLGELMGIKPEQLIWSNLAKPGPLASETDMQTPVILFAKLEDDLIAQLRDRFAGSQAERQARDAETAKTKAKPTTDGQAKPAKPAAPTAPAPVDDRSDEEKFADKVDVRVAKIVEIKRHPDAEKLYIETLDDGSGTPRTIVSGLVPHYKEEELLNRNILVVANLKPAKLRGVMSQGMLLAASSPKPEGGETVEVIFADHASPGDRVHLVDQAAGVNSAIITIDEFFAIPLNAKSHQVTVGSTALMVGGQALTSKTVAEGAIG